MEAQEFDLVVNGSGPAALIEKENVLGGAAANTGTLPSKTLRESALYLSGYRQRGLHGVSDSDGYLKLLFAAEDMRLLGVHVIGEQASELVHVGLTALLTEAGADLFIQTCYNYPTLTELYKYATYDALGKRAAAAA